MNSDFRDLFKELDPPPGGAQRFEARLDAEIISPRPAHGWRIAAVACAALALTVSLVWLSRPDEPQLATRAAPTVDVYNAPELDRLLGRPLRTTELTVVLGDETMAVTRLDTANERVRIYRIDGPGAADAP